jgi:hypothetical protein
MDHLTQAQLIAALLPLPLAAFWFWMFYEMVNNNNLPPFYFTVTNRSDVRLDWTFAFIFLSIFTAIIYYFNVYRHRL